MYCPGQRQFLYWNGGDAASGMKNSRIKATFTRHLKKKKKKKKKILHKDVILGASSKSNILIIGKVLSCHVDQHENNLTIKLFMHKYKYIV